MCVIRGLLEEGSRRSSRVLLCLLWFRARDLVVGNWN